MRFLTIIKTTLIAFALATSFTASAGSLATASAASSSVEINGLSQADAKSVISSASVSEKGSVQKLAMNTSVGDQGNGKVVEQTRSMGCSTGCSSGCSSGCSYGCSYGCR